MKNFLYKSNIFIFTGLLLVMGILFFVLPKQKTSEFEKRDLCQWPEFSVEKLRSGAYIDSVDLYIADNFPFRDNFVSFSFELEQLRGIQSKEIAFYNQSVNMDAGIENMGDSLSNTELSDSNNIATNNPDEDSLGQNSLYHNDGFASEVERLSRGLLIYKGMAIQMFGGGRSTAIHMSRMANDVKKTLGPEIEVYVGVTPTHGEFYLPSEYIEEAVSEKKNIDTIYKYLNPDVKSFDVTKELFEHKDEYIFFNTDHHWTGKGAYYAYVAWCKSAGVKPLPLSAYDHGVIPGFLGTLLSIFLAIFGARLPEVLATPAPTPPPEKIPAPMVVDLVSVLYCSLMALRDFILSDPQLQVLAIIFFLIGQSLCLF